MFIYYEILFLNIINFFTISSSVSIADFEQVNVSWPIIYCSPEKDEAEQTIGDSTEQLCVCEKKFVRKKKVQMTSDNQVAFAEFICANWEIY